MTVYCSAQVPIGGRAVGYRGCSRRAVETRDGKPYCGLHDPVAVAAKKAKKQAAKAAERAEVEAQRAAARVDADRLTALTGVTPQPYFDPFARRSPQPYTAWVLTLADVARVCDRLEALEARDLIAAADRTGP